MERRGEGEAGEGERHEAGAPGDSVPLLAALVAQRGVVERLRDAGRLGETVAERMATELDLDELGVGGEADRLTGAAES